MKKILRNFLDFLNGKCDHNGFDHQFDYKVSNYLDRLELILEKAVLNVFEILPQKCICNGVQVTG